MHMKSILNNALQDAQAAGCKTVSGVEMFIGQAAEQFQLFTAQTAPVDLMRRVVLKSLGQQSRGWCTAT